MKEKKKRKKENLDFYCVKVNLLDNIKDDNVCRNDRDDRGRNVKVNTD